MSEHIDDHGALSRRALLAGAAGSLAVPAAASAAKRPREDPLASLGARVSATDPADFDLLEAAAMLRTRRVSAVELLRACHARIDAGNGGAPSFDGAPRAVNAWVRLYPEVSRARARAADRRLSRERRHAPLLCGIPIGLKDVYAVRGLGLTASSRVLEGNVASADCTVWNRLHAAGMVLVGHTHTHEFAIGATTDQVGNPWRLDRTAGGSSGGSAAALAARMVPAATGTDTGGSLRVPAAFCGVSTIKPSHGRVPLDGIIPLAPSLDHPGPMARTVADCAALLQAMARGGGAVTARTPPIAALGKLSTTPRHGSRPLRGLSVAVTDRLSGQALHPDVQAGLSRARQALQHLGARIVRRRQPASAALAQTQYLTVFHAEMWSYHRRFAAQQMLYRPSVRQEVIAASAPIQAADYVLAQQARDRVAALWAEWFRSERVDLMLEPTAPVPATVRSHGSEQRTGQLDSLLAYTPLWNATGFPVVSLPSGLGKRSGLPVGVSLIAPRGAEATAVRAAVDLQGLALHPPVLNRRGNH